MSDPSQTHQTPKQDPKPTHEAPKPGAGEPNKQQPVSDPRKSGEQPGHNAPKSPK